MRKLLFLWNFLKISGLTIKTIFREEYAFYASALAFTTLLALVPLFTIISSLISLFPISGKYINLTRHYLVTHFLPEANVTIENYLQAFIEQASHLPLIGIFFLIFTTIMLITTVKHAINQIWKSGKKKKLSRILLNWLILFLMPFFIGVSVFLSSYFYSLSWFAGALSKINLILPFLALLPLLINTIIFSMLYIIVPNHKVNIYDGISGAFIAACLFELAKKGFGFYIAHFPSYEFIYGALAAIPIFLIWLYLSWLIVIFGAIFVRLKQQSRTYTLHQLKTSTVFH